MWYSKLALISTLLKSNVFFLCLHVCSFYLNFIACLWQPRVFVALCRMLLIFQAAFPFLCARGRRDSLRNSFIQRRRTELSRKKIWRHPRKQRTSCNPEPGQKMFWLMMVSSSARYSSQNLCLRVYLPLAFRDRPPSSWRQSRWEDVDSVRDTKILENSSITSLHFVVDINSILKLTAL